ncbi:MAG: endonuclease III [Opitutales bacterium]
MTKKERATYVSGRLDELYPEPAIPLDHKDPYTLLVSVLLSAQCTDVRVNKTTPTLFKLADKPSTMVKLSIQAIDGVVRPCGLSPSKAKAIRGLSEILLEKHKGQVPRSFEELEALPGVGHKTASVVMAQAFGYAAFPVDTHIHRLSQRWGLTSGKNVSVTEADLKRLFFEAIWSRLHLQIIYYGREHCTARGCDGTKCEICRTCYPRRRKAVTTQKA